MQNNARMAQRQRMEKNVLIDADVNIPRAGVLGLKNAEKEAPLQTETDVRFLTSMREVVPMKISVIILISIASK